jgi:hypothetical protein
VDVLGFFNNNLLIIQCKDHERLIGKYLVIRLIMIIKLLIIFKLGPNYVRELEGVMTRCVDNSIGILVVPSVNGFSFEAKKRSRTSKYKIILTSEEDLCSEIKKLKRGGNLIISSFVIIFLLIVIILFNVYISILLYNKYNN